MIDPQKAVQTRLNLVRGDDGGYRLILRWQLGTEHLPLPKERFKVRVWLKESGEHLDSSGAFVAGETWIEEVEGRPIAPRLFTMLDPPRRLAEKYPGTEAAWKLAQKPEAPVDCKASLSGTLRTGDDFAAFGVCHLLEETDPSRVAFRAATVVAKAVDERLKNDARLAGFASGLTDLPQNVANQLVDHVLREGIRPLDLPQLITHAYGRLAAQTSAHGGQSGFAPRERDLFSFGGDSLRERWEFAALTASALSQPGVVEALDEAITPPTQARQQLRFRSLQAGKLIDFWCSPDSPDAVCDDALRGAQHIASEVLGIGLTIGRFSAAEVGEWIARGERLTAEIHHVPTPPSLDEPALLALGSERGPFQPGAYSLRAGDMQTALDAGASSAPAPPLAAKISFDLVQSNAATTPTEGMDPGRSRGYSTGDGRVEILIDPAPASDASTTFSFNVYGVWKGADGVLDALFEADTDRPLSPQERERLQRFLITRRYSYERDLRGAFPAQSGLHPALERALADPPWAPIMRRFDELWTTQEGERIKVPNVARGEASVAMFDLRKGTRSGADLQVSSGWDPAGLLDVDWRPEKNRAGEQIQAPQPYRFWVSAVDFFDQESDLVAVRAEDAAAGEDPSYLFLPRRRAALGAPPQGAEEDGGAERFSLERDAQELVARWETPFETNISDDAQSGLDQNRVDRSICQANLVVLRRPLLLKHQGPGLDAGLLALDLPQWVNALQRLQAEGWVEFARRLGVQPPRGGDVWESRVPFGHADRGYEYVAALNVEVKPEASPFWAPNASQRTLWVIEEVGDDYTRTSEIVSETPQASQVALCPVLPIANPELPRPVTFDRSAQAVLTALAVPPPPGVRRDLVLQRLLTHAFTTGGKPTPPVPWADTGVDLSAGQAAMCEAALERVELPPLEGPVDVKTDPRLREARRLLAAELHVPSDPGKPESGDEHAVFGLRQHLSIGFRGLLDLRWGYTPTSDPARPQLPDEAEAVRFRVDGVRVPRDDATARVYASVWGLARLVSANPTTYELSEIASPHGEGSQDEGFEAIARHHRPAALRLIAANGSPVFGVVNSVDGDSPHLVVSELTGTAPAEARFELFVAQPLAEIEVASLVRETSYRLLLPMGGGQEEVFAWWVSSVSAQERESPPSQRSALLREASGTIQPRSPTGLVVETPTDTNLHRLDPARHGDWLPTRIRDEDDARFAPRLMISWTAPETPDLRIRIQREQVRVTVDENKEFAGLAETAWAVIKEIEAAKDNALLSTEDLALIRFTWLKGQVVDVSSAGDEVDYLIATDRPLDAAEGLLSHASRPAFVDYYRFTDDHYPGSNTWEMDANWLYRYRLEAYRDVDPEERLPPEWRYLASEPGEWSPFVLPETPFIEILERDLRVTPLQETVLYPEVTIEFDATLHEGLTGLDGEDDLRWFYRILLRRKVDFSLTSRGPGTPDWVDVGAPLMLAPGAKARVLDEEVERGDLLDSPELTYEAQVSQFAVSDGVERLVRAPANKTGKTFKVLLPPVGEVVEGRYHEQSVTKTIEIDRGRTS